MNERGCVALTWCPIRIYKDLHRHDSKVSVCLTEFDQRRRTARQSGHVEHALAVERTNALRDT